MNKKGKNQKAPISPDQIFFITIAITYAVAAVFLFKNLSANNTKAAVIIGICLAVFGVIVFVMRKLRIDPVVQQTALSILLVCLVLFISLNSGEYYSDDFPLFLALITLTGLYLQPRCTIAQTIAVIIAFIILYIAHPEKAESFSQYVMCVGIFCIAAFANILVIRRGRAFIQIARNRAVEAEELINAIRDTGVKLQENYEDSSKRVHDLQEINQQLEQNTEELKQGSGMVQSESRDITMICDGVQTQMQMTESVIHTLNNEVQSVETALGENREHMNEMDRQVRSIDSTIQVTNEVFSLLQEQIGDIAKLTEQLTTIAFNTKLLAINASIEAARAGQHGTGFSVVANEVQNLAAESDKCSNEVAEVVGNMKQQIEKTSFQLGESGRVIRDSLQTLGTLHHDFDGLIDRFDVLYRNINEQNTGISQMEETFKNLKERVDGMNSCTEENSSAVDSIVNAITVYKSQIERIIDDTTQIHELSSAMMDISNEE